MLKDTLAQYCDLQEEMKGIRNRIDTLERNIKELSEENPIVTDTVTGTRKDGTIGPIKISGFPVVEHYRRQQLLRKNIQKLQRKEDELLELTLEVEDFIGQQENSLIRSILRYRYLENLSWVQIGYRMGRNNTAESCRKQHDRFFSEK